jgi:pyruvate,water dikinase
MEGRTPMTEKWIFWFEEIGRESNDIVGKKNANLGEMTKVGLPVPRGFCLSLEAEKEFLRKTNAAREINQFATQFEGNLHSLEQYQKASQGLRQIVEAKEIPPILRDAIISCYDNLCQRCGTEVAVSVRSAGAVSHPGQYETYLNVKGRDELLHKIVKVWASIYNMQTIAALDRKKMPIKDSPPIGVCVLELINARCAGVGFTCDPMTGDTSKIVIEGSWGLGESVVSGAVIPDRYTVDKNSLNIIKTEVGNKPVKVVSSDKGVVEQEIPPAEQGVPCLNDVEVSRIAELAKLLEAHFGVPQDMEWAVSADCAPPDNIFLLQTRPVAGI